ncbi:MAG: hypothetical protein ACTSPB_18390 [Candidatus Thorarchaeota archaeon]
MGCWNETCIVSNLPVTGGDEVAMTVVTRNEDGEWYKPNSLFYVSPIMFYGEYNEYGTSEECHGLGLHFTADEFRKYKTPIGDDLKPDQFVEKIAREELKFHDVKTFRASLMGMENSDNHARLGFIRKDILDRIMEDFSWQETFYAKDEHESFIYEKINYQYFLDCIPEAIKTFKAYYKKAEEEAKVMGGVSHTLMFHPVPDSDMKDTNTVVRWIYAHSKESQQQPFHKSIGEKIKSMAEANQDEQLTDFLAEFSKYAILYRFMMESRKAFTPQPNTSQDVDTDGHQFLAKITTEVADEMAKKYDDDSEWDPVRKVLICQDEFEF